ncbi:hypothetical protein L1987_12758 [Smallanthus sonchifolius]|uniref:Uncharacterized protein n=1 Tax=Smallanthus sonchifolius TaxID=185202 RepID=A0ACB9JGU8_9ASTR|nr:hypothetical protein L1987_12758 [Smallanthus sonchifolius]
MHEKAVAGTGILISALVFMVQPLFVSPAFASFQTAIKTGPGSLARTELLSSAWTGFFAGCLHTLSGPDHLDALAPLSIGRSRVESALVGALWGCGHDAGQQKQNDALIVVPHALMFVLCSYALKLYLLWFSQLDG